MMGITFGGRGVAVAEINVVPLIDILLVLLVIFMIIPAHQKGLDAQIPQSSTPSDSVYPPADVIVVQVQANGTLRINQELVEWENLRARLEEVFKFRATRTAFIRGEELVEFSAVARVIDVMYTAGIASVGLLTPELEKGR